MRWYKPDDMLASRKMTIYSKAAGSEGSGGWKCRVLHRVWQNAAWSTHSI